MSDPPDFSSYDGICAWFDEHALDKIREEYDEDFLTFGIAFITLEHGKVLPEISPVPVISEADLADESYQQDFADQLRNILKNQVATGVAMVVHVQEGGSDEVDGIEGAVIVALEHKGGRAAWIAMADDNGLGKFKRDDAITWKHGHVFADLMPKRSMN